MLTILKLELEKLFRAKSFYLSFVVLTAFVALMLWGFYTYAARKTGGEAVEQYVGETPAAATVFPDDSGRRSLRAAA